MRIQNEIVPSNIEYESRKERDNQLKQISQTKASNWPDSIEMKKNSRKIGASLKKSEFNVDLYEEK